MNDTLTADEALKQAELRIQRILLDLAERLGQDIEHVEVDTRNFSNLRVEISLR
jgi:exonuclease VII small subunit